MRVVTRVAQASRASRRCAAAAAMAAVGLAATVLGACTPEGADGDAGGATASVSVVGGYGPPASAAPLAAPPAAQPEPSMTFIEAAPQCATTRALTGKGRVPLDAVFPGAETSAFSDPKEVVPGVDAGDRARCPGELPPEPLCDGLVPWTGLLPEEFVAASGARRLVQGYLLTMPKQAGNQAPPESSAGTKAVTYGLVDLAAGDPAGLLGYLDAGFAACAKATPSTVAGVNALVGTVRSEYGAGTAEVVLLHAGTHVVWASLDGSGWQAREQRRALAVLAGRLL